MTEEHVSNWTWEVVWGKRVPKITLEERVEWTRLQRASFHSDFDTRVFGALHRKIEYRRKKLLHSQCGTGLNRGSNGIPTT